jgi:hypothetical protein
MVDAHLFFNVELRSRQSMLFSFLDAMDIFNGLKWSGRKANQSSNAIQCALRLHVVVLVFKRR